MKKHILGFLLVGSFAMAQNLTIEETVTGPRKYAPTTQVAQQWRKDSKSITFLSADYANLMEKSAQNGWKAATLATKSEFEAALKDKIPTDIFSLRMFPYEIKWKNATSFDTEVTGKNNNYKVTFDVNSKKITTVVILPNDAGQLKIKRQCSLDKRKQHSHYNS